LKGNFHSRVLHDDIFFQSCQADFLENSPDAFWSIPTALKSKDTCEKSPEKLPVNYWNTWNSAYKKYIVPYYFTADFLESAHTDEFQNIFLGSTAAAEVKKQAQAFKENTCVEFLEIKEENLDDFPDAFKIDKNLNPDFPCISFLGHETGQTLKMRADCPKMNEETGVVHLFMHILGFTHESSRFDRMDYIGVSDAYLNSTEFYRFPWAEDDQFIEYDFNSVLHHPAYIGQDGLPNIYNPSRPSEFPQVELQSPFSEVDILKIQLKYPCSSENECLNYPSPCGSNNNLGS
jgi:hypothetical protein